MNQIPPENMAVLVGCLCMFISGIWMARKLRKAEENMSPQIIQAQPQQPPVIRDMNLNPLLNPARREALKIISHHNDGEDIDPRDLRTLRALGFQPRILKEHEEKREEPEPRQQRQGVLNLPSRDIYLCLECGRRVEYVEYARIYRPGVGLIAIPRCPFCGAPIGPPKIIEKEEVELPSLRSIEPPEFPENSPKGLGIEHPSLEDKAGEDADEED